jgi:hypothetical protein
VRAQTARAEVHVFNLPVNLNRYRVNIRVEFTLSVNLGVADGISKERPFIANIAFQFSFLL